MYPPSGSHFELHLVTEQAPDPMQRITLSADRYDDFGLPLARIDWRVNDDDIARFLDVGALAVESWRTGGLQRYARLVPRPAAEVVAALSLSGGIYHPAGTTRIGATAETGVVDRELNVHGVRGLRALATSVFPTVGGSSPSLALVQLALRLAEDIIALDKAERP